LFIGRGAIFPAERNGIFAAATGLARPRQLRSDMLGKARFRRHRAAPKTASRQG